MFRKQESQTTIYRKKKTKKKQGIFVLFFASLKIDVNDLNDRCSNSRWN